MNHCLILVFLWWNAWIDWKKRQISLVSVGTFAAIEIARVCYQGGFSWLQLAPAGIAGLFIAVSILSGGALGLGDGLVLLGLAFALNLEEYLVTVLLGLFCSAVAAGGLFLFFYKGKNKEIPFIPFLLAGYVGGLLLW